MLPLLSGVRVLDLCKLIPGGMATAKLADLGAEVIKVEEPPLGDYIRGVPPVINGISYWDLTINRNKKSLGLNLKTDEGRRIFFELLETADVLVEVSKPGTFQRLGIDYASLREHKPDLVYCSLTGYGQDGPYKRLPSHGKNIDATAGQVSVGRDADGRPQMRGSPSVGIDQGAMHAALGVVAALFQRMRTGEGQYLDVSCWDGAVAANKAFGTALNFGEKVQLDPFAQGAAVAGPKYSVYATKDDKLLLICPVERKFWVSFCSVIGRDDWADRGTWKGHMDTGEDDPTLREDLTTVMATRTLDEWMEALLAADVPASPVLRPEELVDDPHVQHRRIVVDSDDPRYPDIKYLRIPITLPDAPFFVAHPPPVLGEHTAEILADLGYDDAAQVALSESGAVAFASSIP